MVNLLVIAHFLNDAQGEVVRESEINSNQSQVENENLDQPDSEDFGDRGVH